MNFSRIHLSIWTAAAAIQAGPNYNLPLDRPYTLRNAEPFVLEAEMARQIRSEGAMSFIFPRPCFSEADSSRVCGESHGFSFQDGARNRNLSISPLIGYEYRRTGEDVSAFDGGLLMSGGSGPVSFYLDARMFTELHEDPDHPSYDREFVERQDEKASGSIAYSSYSRYRSSVNLDFPWARFSAGRESMHWGPAIYANLSFNQHALPFNQVSWLSHLGPVSVLSVYGRLAIHGDETGSFAQEADVRSLYAHRYEWRISHSLLLGISEQLVLYNQEEPFAFLPVVPLFILKGSGVERWNNGNIAADITYQLGKAAILYSEFFIDDIQSPTSLFDDNWGNKWAWMAGFHLSRRAPSGNIGLIAEYSRVEPWTYTHYTAGTAQTANGGHPLGNPLGPNSQWVLVKPYWRYDERFYAAVLGDITWKGKEKGSTLNDEWAGGASGKGPFHEGLGSPRFGVALFGGISWKTIHVQSAAALGRDRKSYARVQYSY